MKQIRKITHWLQKGSLFQQLLSTIIGIILDESLELPEIHISRNCKNKISGTEKEHMPGAGRLPRSIPLKNVAWVDTGWGFSSVVQVSYRRRDYPTTQWL